MRRLISSNRCCTCCNIGTGRHTATGGILLFDGEGHFPVFFNAQAQHQEFLRSLAYDGAAVVPSP